MAELQRRLMILNTNLLCQCHLLFEQIIIFLVDESLVESFLRASDVDVWKMPCVTTIDPPGIWSIRLDGRKREVKHIKAGPLAVVATF